MNIDYIGGKSRNTFGTEMIIVAARKRSDIDVQFLDERKYIKEHATYNNFKKGQIKNPYDKTVYGIGYIGVGKFHPDEGDRREYVTWRNMLRRCYYDKENFPSYYNIVTVCDEWHNFQNFGDWYEENYYECEGRLHLDKDILLPGNKIYSPSTCLLVPQKINMIFMEHKRNKDGLPEGISLAQNRKYVSQYQGKYLGTYDNLDAAVDIHNKAKQDFIKEIAEEQKEIIPLKVYEALIKHKVA